MEVGVGYFGVYVINWLFFLFFKTNFEDVHESEIHRPDKLPSVSETVLAEQLLLSFSGGCDIFFILREKITSCACLFG